MAEGKKTQITMDYTAERTARFFHASKAFVRGVRGPRGMGKSVMCIWEIILKANQQVVHEGMRRSRWGVIRNSYPDLKSSTIESWKAWFPEEAFPISWDAPITAHVRYPLPDKTIVELEVLFIALDKPKDVRKLLSTEFTGIWLNEARELTRPVVDQATASVGRYPAVVAGGSNFKCVIMDTNPPDDDHWWYTLFEQEKPIGWEQFIQPPWLVGDNIHNLMPNNGQVRGIPKAENVHNMQGGFSYAIDMAAGKRWDWIKVYLLNQYATVSDGKPVYPEYNDEIHCSKTPLDVYRGLPLTLGLDFGLTPSAAVCQYSPHGQLRVIDEICGTSIGLRRFIRENLRPHLHNHYQGMPVTIWGDPAGNARSQNDEVTCYDILREEGFSANPTSDNGFKIRRESVARYLNMMIDGQPGFIMDPKCTMLRKGFNGRYCLSRKQLSGREEYKDEPDDNPYTHIHDGLQYAAERTQTTIIAPPVQQEAVKVVVRNPVAWA